MTIKEYKLKFIELFEQMEKEHGEVSKVVIETSIRYEIPSAGVKETVACCTIQFGEMD